MVNTKGPIMSDLIHIGLLVSEMNMNCENLTEDGHHLIANSHPDFSK
jgi:hypothetical protein